MDSQSDEEEEEPGEDEYGDEAILAAQVRMEIAEEDALKHLTEEQIQALVNQAEDVSVISQLHKDLVRRGCFGQESDQENDSPHEKCPQLKLREKTAARERA